jgi:hypothetical protein
VAAVGDAARKLRPAPPAPANDALGVPPELRPFVEAFAQLIVRDLERRPPGR